MHCTFNQSVSKTQTGPELSLWKLETTGKADPRRFSRLPFFDQKTEKSLTLGWEKVSAPPRYFSSIGLKVEQNTVYYQRLPFLIPK